MRILFVHGSLDIGGIETLIVRAARYLSRRGHSVSLLLNRPGDARLVQEASRYSDIFYAGETVYPRSRIRTDSPLMRKLLTSRFDYVYCSTAWSLILGLLIKEYLPTARIIAGVYWPREYCYPSKRKRYVQTLIEDVIRKMPARNVFFANETNARAHGRCLGRDFSSSPIFPLPIDTGRFETLERRVDRRKIVSIGRIASFKTYNFHMVDVIRTLNKTGYNFEYHIYGDGDDLSRLRDYVIERGMERSVFLHGTIPYAWLEDALADAFVFVGMGTSLVEASACGVPALIAIASNEKPTTYGFFHDTVGYDVGEFVLGRRQVSIIEKIEELFRLEASDYSRVSVESVQRAQDFSMEEVMTHFLRSLNEAEAFDYNITSYMKMRDVADLWIWRLLKLLGFEDPLKKAYA